MFNQKSRYDVNPTMEMIGHQPCIYDGSENLLEDVFDAQLLIPSDSFDFAMDAFALGVIFGKRLERARRKAARS